MDRTEWILCPFWGNKTRNKVREDTVLKNYPLYCPKCRQETLIEAKNLQVTVIKEPDTLDAEPMNMWEITICRLLTDYAAGRYLALVAAHRLPTWILPGTSRPRRLQSRKLDWKRCPCTEPYPYRIMFLKPYRKKEKCMRRTAKGGQAHFRIWIISAVPLMDVREASRKVGRADGRNEF